MSSFPDPIAQGLARGWKVFDGTDVQSPSTLEADVVIIGSGAGGGISAEMLAIAGLRVIIIEEGPLKSSRDFNMRESEAYPLLYQESAGRKTKDKAINILQGRTVGGSTTVNWTSSFRTPGPTLAVWREQFGLKQFTDDAMAPWFSMAEKRLSIGPWLAPPNENNDLLRRGAAKLGIPAAAILRNVKGCFNLGYCGVGCPTNAKQAMLVTTIPAALDRHATLLTRARAQRFVFSSGKAAGEKRIESLVVHYLGADGLYPNGKQCSIKAKHYVLAGGAINSPGLLLRSEAPDPAKVLGKRTFLHPTLISSALMPQHVNGFEGAPQTIYTDHFLDIHPIDGPMGYKLEAPPIHPVLFASTLMGFGREHAEQMKMFQNTHALLALMRDGFHPDSPGGQVGIDSAGAPVLDYALNGFLFEAARRALTNMAEIQFSAGAKTVYPVHEKSTGYQDFASAKAAIASFEMAPFLLRVVSAHVMGGCAMATEPNKGVVAADGLHFQIPNLSIHDGSIFPTSIGANPQLSVYGQVVRLTHGLVQRLTGKTDASLLSVA
jgi:choline dehydrogenase-like flavoprotein